MSWEEKRVTCSNLQPKTYSHSHVLEEMWIELWRKASCSSSHHKLYVSRTAYREGRKYSSNFPVRCFAENVLSMLTSRLSLTFEKMLSMMKLLWLKSIRGYCKELFSRQLEAVEPPCNLTSFPCNEWLQLPKKVQFLVRVQKPFPIFNVFSCGKRHITDNEYQIDDVWLFAIKLSMRYLFWMFKSTTEKSFMYDTK